ncbi:putative two-component system response regulator [Rhodoblastus acidophilus]|uniref:response regulator n=1 Tax=Rhodoblastus acidophilus TaxID=1074 RepID=UPI002224E9B9|nr:response regulator [Rhodoblastus acidophilus]MCW2286056.1 putative two-component system response regulator [Rhodoblastus acidophilus]MCW2334950.1 putative two-component system response regulator [Rhodoblastus acidophilus]
MLVKIEELNRNEEEFFVLAVDDSQSMRAILETTIRKIPGLQIDTCGNPLDAIKQCEGFQFDLIIIDYLMPEMNGIELLKHLRRLETCRDIPIIMLTRRVIAKFAGARCRGASTISSTSPSIPWSSGRESPTCWPCGRRGRSRTGWSPI